MAHSVTKTYTLQESDSDDNGFVMKPAEEVYFSSSGESDAPHRHDYYAVILLEKARGIHYIDFHKYDLEDNTVYFILPGQMHQLIPFSAPKGWVLSFNEAFLIRNSISESLINDIYLFNDYGQSPPLPLNPAQMAVYKSLIDQMFHFSSSLVNYTNDALGSLLKLFLIQSNNHCTLIKDNNPQFLETTNHLLRSFKKLLNEHYKTKHMVSDYAEMLAVTPDYLNKTVKNITGKSAKDHIQSKIIIEAKRSLIFTNLTVKEITFELGFDEPSHFHNFFKKYAGLTPTEFKNSIRLS